MHIVDRGVLNQEEPGSPRAVSAFPAVAALPDGSLLATYRIGADKDSADGTIEFRRSEDGGRSWGPPSTPLETTVDGVQGSLRVAYITPLEDRRLILAALWVDRETYAGKPLFNEQTEGCLPMRVLLADSYDLGETWGPWRMLPAPEDVGPPSLTNPVVQLPGGRLAISVETNKPYYDDSPWMQRVVYFYSSDQGQTWDSPVTVCQDPAARIFSWDQRAAMDPQGGLATFSWTYDRDTESYLNIQRRLSHDEGASWSEPEDLGFTDQPSRPAVLPDGRVVLAWVDRFGSQSIRARFAPSITAPFFADSEVALYEHTVDARSADHADTGKLLDQMISWTYGLPYAETLPDGDVMVVYYAGDAEAMRVEWVRLAVDDAV